MSLRINLDLHSGSRNAPGFSPRRPPQPSFLSSSDAEHSITNNYLLASCLLLLCYQAVLRNAFADRASQVLHLKLDAGRTSTNANYSPPPNKDKEDTILIQKLF